MSDKVTEYFNGSFLPSDVWKEKYQLTTIDGEPKEETPEDMHKRMAEHFGRIEESYRSERTSVLKNKPELLSEYGRSRDELYEDKVFELFDEFEYIVPQGSIMSMLGNPYQVGSLSNCLAGETKVLTRSGFTPIKDLAGKTVEILTKGGKWKEAPFHSFGEQKLYEIELERGKDNQKTIYATKDHRWFESFSSEYSYKLREKTTSELLPGDKLKLQFEKGKTKKAEKIASRWKVISVNETNRLEEVYCATVPETESFVIEGNILSGNCIVIEDAVDSYGGILYKDQQLAQLMKRRCGAGLDVSRLRPEGAGVSNAARTSTGAVSFMHRFSDTTNEVAQCIEESQEVLTKSGLQKIKNVSTGDDVWTKQGWVSVENTIESLKEAYRVKTSRGYTVETSKDHVFSVLDGDLIDNKKLDDLKVGDKINLLEGTPSMQQSYVVFSDKWEYEKDSWNNSNQLNEDVNIPEVLDEKFAYVLGVLYGDGHVEKKSNGRNAGLSCSFHENETKQVKKFLDYFEDTFHHKFKKRDRDSDDACKRFRMYSRKIVSFLNDNGLLKGKANNLSFPKKIKKSPVSVQASFVAGYFDADGDAAGSKAGYRFTSIDRNFIENVQKILFSLGITSKIHIEREDNERWSTKYRIAVVGREAQKRFVELIGEESVKTAQSGFVAKRDSVLTSYKAETHDISHNKYSYVPDNYHFLSTSCFSRLSEEKNLPKSLIQDEIVDIECVGCKKMVDLELAQEHLFWCEGFYVHNSGRRGALMLTLDCRHPDMTRFVEEKDDPTTMTGANISAKWTDDFLEAVENNENYTLRFPVDADPEEAEITKEVNARELFKTASENAHIHGGDPGCLYIDRMENYSTGCGYPDVRIVSTNPCGEIPMSEDACRLIAMNLMSVVEEPFTDEASINYDLLYEISYEQQRLLDNLVDLEIEAIDRIIEKVKNDPEADKYKRVEIETWQSLKESCKKYRRTGGGFTALGDMLAALGIEYGSEKCDEVLHEVMSTKLEGEWDASTDLAIERGTFPEWDSQYDDTEFFDMLEDEFPEIYERNMEHGRRNISLSTVAPTGSVSLMSKICGDFGTTSGIEPLFSTEKNKAWHIRNKRADGSEDYDYVDEEGNKWKQYPVFHNGFRIWMEENGYENPTEKPEEELKEIFKESPYVTSAGLHWKDRLRTQGIAQHYVSHSISSTLNLPESADVEETYKIYKNGRKYGLKGATIFRNGSKRGVLEGEDGGSSDESEITYHDAPERPEVLEADIHQVRYNGEPWKILVGRLEGKPYEVFAIKTGKDTGIRVRFTDSDDNKIEEGLIRKTDSGVYNFEAKDGKVVIEDIAEYAPDDNVRVDTRLLSLNLRHGVKPEYLVSQLEKADGSVVSFGRAILKALRSYLDVDPDDKCPECGEESLAFLESCLKCRSCGWSRC